MKIAQLERGYHGHNVVFDGSIVGLIPKKGLSAEDTDENKKTLLEVLETAQFQLSNVKRPPMLDATYTFQPKGSLPK